MQGDAVAALWCCAEAYRRDGKFRAWLEQRRVGYVVAVDSRQAIAGDAGTSRADALAADAPDQAWRRRSCGNGSKGPRVFDWAATTLPEDGAETAGWSRYLLARRSLTRNTKGELEGIGGDDARQHRSHCHLDLRCLERR